LETTVDAAMLQQGYGVTVRSYPVSRGATMYPTPRVQRIPDYPIEMRRHGVSGIVVLRIAVGSNGIPRVEKVLWSSQAELERAAREAVSSWNFLPAESDGRAAEVEVDYKFEFKVYASE
jgi:TonB family protein